MNNDLSDHCWQRLSKSPQFPHSHLRLMISRGEEIGIKAIVGVQAAYGLGRIINSAFERGWLAIGKYWSRLLFRTFMTIHLITLTCLPLETDNIVIFAISQLDELTLLMSFLLLAKSVQDFAGFSNRQIRWLVRAWPFITLGLCSINGSIDIFIIVKAAIDKEYDYTGLYCYLITSHAVVVIALVCVPLQYFTLNLRQSVLTKTMTKKVWIAVIINTANGVIVAGTLILSMMMRWVKMVRKTIGSAGLTSFEMWIRVIVLIGYFFIQDALDWMAKWMFTDDDETTNDDNVLKEPILQARQLV